MKTPRVLVVVISSIALAAVLFLFVLPTRTYLAQRQSLQNAERRLQVFNAENAKLSDQAQRLNTNAEIERIAHQKYGLVMPGQQSLVITPSSPQAPAAKPVHHRSLPSRIWHDVQFWHAI